jgi:hypothetical protein
MFGLRNTSKGLRRHRSHRTPVESLESRTLLAGNVVTTPTGTPNSPGQPAPFVEIDGDASDNEIMIKKGTAPGEIIVNGLNGTLVNGSTQEWHFNGVQALGAFMNAGNDNVDVRNLTLSGVPDENGQATAQVVVDGGNGDDRLTLFNTTINASAPPPNPSALFFPSSSVGIILVGETASFDPVTETVVQPSGTGNDFIEVSNTTIIADGGEMSGSSVLIYGELNQGGNITGGNDHVNVSNTVIRATNTSFASGATAAIAIYGEDNSADNFDPSHVTSTIGQGNDWINVNNTDIIADSAQGSGAVFVQVFGDNNSAFGTGTATIGNFAAKTGGNDTISLANTTVSARGANFSNNSVVVDIRGDQNFSQAAVADVGGGNDNISITNFAASASGADSTNETFLRVFGDGDVRATLDVTSRVGVGNDVISLANDDIFSSGNPNNAASVEFYSDDATQTGETGTTVGQGDDDVTIANFLLQASTASNIQLHTQKGNDVVDVHNVRFGGWGMSTGSGDDDVTVLNSRWVNGNWDFEDGNDILRMNGNTFVMTDADGGVGDIDTLQAHGNTGVLIPTNFEVINIT